LVEINGRLPLHSRSKNGEAGNGRRSLKVGKQ